MKFWQLISIAREQPQLVSRVASQRVGWKQYGENAANFSSLIAEQNRRILDEIVDPDFSEAVLSRVRRPLFLGQGWLRMRPLNSEREISALEAARHFGGEAVEDAFEKGSIAVGKSPPSC